MIYPPDYVSGRGKDWRKPKSICILQMNNIKNQQAVYRRVNTLVTPPKHILQYPAETTTEGQLLSCKKKKINSLQTQELIKFKTTLFVASPLHEEKVTFKQKDTTALIRKSQCESHA